MNRGVSRFLMVGILLVFTPSAAFAGRLHLKHGYAVEAETWWRDGALIYYEQRGTTSAVTANDVIRFEGPFRARVNPDHIVVEGTCRTPQIDDPETVLLEYFKCRNVKPWRGTVTREGRQFIGYNIGGSSADWYYLFNGRIHKIETMNDMPTSSAPPR